MEQSRPPYFTLATLPAPNLGNVLSLCKMELGHPELSVLEESSPHGLLCCELCGHLPPTSVPQPQLHLFPALRMSLVGQPIPLSHTVSSGHTRTLVSPPPPPPALPHSSTSARQCRCSLLTLPPGPSPPHPRVCTC